MARTDALAVEGLEAAIDRACACVEAGADMIFPEAMTELSMYRKFADAVKVPVLANITEFGQTPLFTVEELRAANVSLVLYPLSAFRAMNQGGAERLPRDPARRHAEKRARYHADARGSLRFSGLSRLRAEARSTVRQGKTSMSSEAPTAAPTSEAQEIGRSVRRAGRQHRVVHGRPPGQRPALPRLRHPRFRRQREFEEVAYLLVHGKLPTAAELTGYKTKLKALRGLPARVQDILECIPANTHPMDVLRTGCSALGSVLPERPDHKVAEARNVADRMMASFGSMLLYWYHFSHSGRRIDVETDDDSIGGHFLHLLHGKPPSPLWVRAMHTSLILYAEHEFNASTFTARVIAGTGSDMHSAITGAIGALKGPKHGGANEFAFDVIGRYDTPDAGRGRHRASA